MGFFKSTPAKTEQVQRYSPEHQQLLDQIAQMGMEGLQDPTSGFDPIEQKELSRYEEETIPRLAERFASMGQGAGRSSGFRAALGMAGSGLGESLAAQKAQYGLQSRGLMQQLLGMGLGQRFDPIYQPSQKGFLQSSIEQAPKRLMKMGGMFLGL